MLIAAVSDFLVFLVRIHKIGANLLLGAGRGVLYHDHRKPECEGGDNGNKAPPLKKNADRHSGGGTNACQNTKNNS